jgi:DNA-binding transcriptional MerR regulator
MATTTIEPQYMETGDVARTFGVSVAAVRKWEREGKLASPPIRTKGGRRLFTAEQVEELRAQRQARQETPPLDAA